MEQAGIIELRSGNHPWMKGFVIVANDFQQSDVTGPSGQFRLWGLGAGAYNIEAWHERYGSKIQEIVIKPGEAPFIRFVFEAAQTRSDNP
jgi:hypothetical protein